MLWKKYIVLGLETINSMQHRPITIANKFLDKETLFGGHNKFGHIPHQKSCNVWQMSFSIGRCSWLGLPKMHLVDAADWGCQLERSSIDRYCHKCGAPRHTMSPCIIWRSYSWAKFSIADLGLPAIAVTWYCMVLARPHHLSVMGEQARTLLMCIHNTCSIQTFVRCLGPFSLKR